MTIHHNDPADNDDPPDQPLPPAFPQTPFTNIGAAEQWDRVREAGASSDPLERQRASAAIRNAVLCGTDPSWFGF